MGVLESEGYGEQRDYRKLVRGQLDVKGGHKNAH